MKSGLAEVMVSRDMFGEMLERIGRLRPVPGEKTTGERKFMNVSRLPGAKCATCKVRFGLKRPFRVFPSRSELYFSR